jgi:hypothetical protein
VSAWWLIFTISQKEHRRLIRWEFSYVFTIATKRNSNVPVPSGLSKYAHACPTKTWDQKIRKILSHKKRQHKNADQHSTQLSNL